MVSTSNSNVTDNINSITSEILCRSTIEPPNNTTIIAKEDSDASNNYWCNEDIPVLADITDVHNRPTVQLPKNDTMSDTQAGHIPSSLSLSKQASKAHIFDGIHSASLISLGQLCDDGFI